MRYSRVVDTVCLLKFKKGADIIELKKGTNIDTFISK